MTVINEATHEAEYRTASGITLTARAEADDVIVMIHLGYERGYTTVYLSSVEAHEVADAITSRLERPPTGLSGFQRVKLEDLEVTFMHVFRGMQISFGLDRMSYNLDLTRDDAAALAEMLRWAAKEIDHAAEARE